MGKRKLSKHVMNKIPVPEFTEEALINALNKIPAGTKIFETDLVAIKQENAPIHPDDVFGRLSPERYAKQLDAYTKYHAKVEA